MPSVDSTDGRMDGWERKRERTLPFAKKNPFLCFHATLLFNGVSMQSKEPDRSEYQNKTAFKKSGFSLEAVKADAEYALKHATIFYFGSS